MMRYLLKTKISNCIQEKTTGNVVGKFADVLLKGAGIGLNASTIGSGVNAVNGGRF